jgi:transcriptional regulator with GAF, ATPase, and Fis domain
VVVQPAEAGDICESVGESVSVGTDPGNDLVLTDTAVSRFHCEVVVQPDGVHLRDLGSKNGTALDGLRVYDAAPRQGSLINIGRSVLRFELSEQHNDLPISSARSFGGLVGESISMRVAFELLERAARSSATVLLHGETGTGKEAAARAVHDASDRRDRPYVIVDCSALPSNLLDSELFGHERGAFSGAIEQRTGAFEEADGGTVFLDEIGELPLELQPKLLRVLESRQIRRVGSNQHQPIDVRIVAATHRDLREEVNRGDFRADLFYRVGVVKVSLPPLRARPEDVPVLVDHIVEELGVLPDARAAVLDDAFMASLRRAAWRGNVRELRNYLEQCLVLQHVLPLEQSRSDDAAVEIDATRSLADNRRRWLDRLERQYLDKVMRDARGKVAVAAQLAGLDRAYLYRLLAKYRLR